MVVMTNRYGQVEIPDWVVDRDSFRDWVHGGDLPEKLKVHFINGHVWMDLMEELFSHNRAKLAIAVAIETLCQSEELGMFFTDGALYSNDAADLTTGPDGIFVSAASLHARRVTFTAGRTTQAEATEIVGTPDLVVEVVSPSSVTKDLVNLMAAYHEAGIREYWVADVRDDVQFTIHRRSPKGYVAVRKVRGWSKSDVLGRSFRLVQREQFGLLDFVLEVK